MNDSATKKARAFIRQMNMLCGPMRLEFIIGNREDLLDLLLSKNISAINRYLKLYFVRAVGSCQLIRCINPNDLYIFFENNRVGYILGSDLTSPCIKIPTIHQIREEFNWFRSVVEKPPVPFAFDYIDELLYARVDYSVRTIESLQAILDGEVSPWECVILSNEGKEIQDLLLRKAKQILEETRESISILKDLKAPYFIQENFCRYLEREKIIAKRLSKVTHS